MKVPILTNSLTFNANIFNVRNSLFLKCFIQDGGDFFSEFNGKQCICFCTFVNCSAKERGGAFFIKKDNVKVSSCCALECYGDICPDMICAVPTKVDLSLIQCYKSRSIYHLCYMSSNDVLRIKNANITKCETQAVSRYGAIVLCIWNTEFDVKYINVNECLSPGTLGYEYISSKEVSTKFLNAINNNNTVCLFFFSSLSLSTFNICNSSLLYDKVSEYYSFYESSEVTLIFIGYKFSFSEQTTELITLKECAFSFLSSYELDNNAYCYQHSKYSCKYTSKKMTNHCLFFVFIHTNS